MPELNLDPTDNVQRLIDDMVARLTGLMDARNATHNEAIRRLDERIDSERMREDDLREALAQRSDDLRAADNEQRQAVRSVDVDSVKVASQKAGEQATVLANQVDKSAETLRQLVAATAASSSTQIAQQLTQVTDRLSSLEKIQSEIRGSSSGMRDLSGWIFGGIIALVSVATLAFALLRHS